MLKRIVKIVGTLLGLYLAYRGIDWQTIPELIKGYDYKYVFAASVVTLVGSAIVALRLKELTSSSISLWKLIKINLIATFFNLVLPSSIGGDAVKVSLLSKNIGSLQRSTILVIVDRFYGILSLILINLLIVLPAIFFSDFAVNSWVLNFVLITSLAVVFLWTVSNRINPRKFLKGQYEIKIFKYRKILKIENFISGLEELQKFSLGKKIKILTISAIYRLSISLIIYLGLLSFNITVPFVYLMVFDSISTLLLMLPISIGGIGVRDYIYKVLYGGLTTSPHVVLLAPFVLLVNSISGIIGGIVFLLEREETEASLTAKN